MIQTQIILLPYHKCLFVPTCTYRTHAIIVLYTIKVDLSSAYYFLYQTTKFYVNFYVTYYINILSSF